MVGVISHLLVENRRLKRENWQLLQALYENDEAMKNYAKMRITEGPP